MTQAQDAAALLINAAQSGANVVVTDTLGSSTHDTLTLNNVTVSLGNAAGTTFGRLNLGNTETLGGTGTVVFSKDGPFSKADIGAMIKVIKAHLDDPA